VHGWCFVRRIRPDERPGFPERFEIQVLGDDGRALAVGYAGADTSALTVDGHVIPVSVIEAAKGRREGEGPGANAKGPGCTREKGPTPALALGQPSPLAPGQAGAGRGQVLDIAAGTLVTRATGLAAGGMTAHVGPGSLQTSGGGSFPASAGGRGSIRWR